MLKVSTIPQSRKGYAYKIEKFMKYCVAGYVINHSEDFEKLLDFDSDKITDLLNDYVD